VGVGPGKTEKLEIEEYHPEDTQYQLSELDDDQVTLFAQQKELSPQLQEIFRKVLAQKNEVDNFQAEITQRQQEVEAITKDQARLRENMKALKGSPEEKALLQRYTHQLDSQEDRLGVLNKEILDFSSKKAQAANQLDQMVQQITMDENF
jgi:chromosome segregation ATPase